MHISPRRILAGLLACLWAAVPARAAAATTAADLPRIAFTADTEGHLQACNSCPGPVGLGGLARRATAVRQLRAKGPLLLLDGGNAPFGDPSVASRGAAVTAAYAAIGYDAVNVSYRDFRYGRDATLKLFTAVHPVSANLLDGDTGKALFAPFVVVPVGGQRVAVIGLTESPAGLTVLPMLRRQLAGVRIDPPGEALARALPLAQSQADRVVLLYYGSPATLGQIDAKLLGQCAPMLVGGMRPGELPPGMAAIAADPHGRSLTVIEPGAAPSAAQTVPMDASVARDEAVDTLLETYRPAAVALPVVVPATMPTSQPAPSAVAVATPATPPPVTSVPPPPAVVATVPPGPPPTAKPPIIGRRVSARSAQQPRGLAGVRLTAEQVNAAIDRGCAGLWAYIGAHDLAKGTAFGGDQTHVLAALALVHCDLHKRDRAFDDAVRSYLTNVDPYRIGTYQCGLLAMLIEAYDDPRFDAKLRLVTRYLLEAQGPDGTWNYGVQLDPGLLADGTTGLAALRVVGGEDATEGPVPDDHRWHRATPWDKKVTGDNSATQFALLGLSSASRLHLSVSTDLWRRALATYGRRACPDGGWAYNEPVGSAYGSMTCAGICATAICRHELGEADPPADPMVERGLGWLDDHFTVAENPGRSTYRMYYLYSLERVGRVLDTEFIGDHEWYPLGARALLDGQRPDGLWPDDPSEDDVRVSSSFALLFLTRATPTLAPVARHGGPGLLRTAIASPPPATVYVILDASGSMLDDMAGREKFDVARAAVADLVAALPDHAHVALRVYGHQHRAIDKGANEDTALEVPMGELDRAAFAAKLASLRPRGLTPMALSLDDAIKDLGSTVDAAHPVTVVLLTDGGEDTRPRRDPVRSAAALGQVKGITFHIVGFDIHEQDWSDQLHAMCDASGGRYWPAVDAGELQQNVRSAVLGIPRGFTVVDANGRPIDHGQFGDQRPLPEGKYTLTASYDGRPYKADFRINTDATTGVLFDATHAVPGAAEPTPARPAIARFCTTCGRPLPPGAKFCPSCGAPVPKP